VHPSTASITESHHTGASFLTTLCLGRGIVPEAEWNGCLLWYIYQPANKQPPADRAVKALTPQTYPRGDINDRTPSPPVRRSSIRGVRSHERIQVSYCVEALIKRLATPPRLRMCQRLPLLSGAGGRISICFFDRTNLTFPEQARRSKHVDNTSNLFQRIV